MNVRLTERDRRLLAKCAVCRWLTTDQLKRLCFPEATLNAVQKRLRKLAEAGYLRSYQEHPTAESVHAVGPKDRCLVEEKGIAVMAASEVSRQMEHLLGINEVRIAVETADVQVAYYFAYWELFDLGWRETVVPDAIFALQATERRTFIVEYDRGTVTLRTLSGKLRRYAEGLNGFLFEAVLVVTEERRRLDLLAGEMRREGLTVPVLVAKLDGVREAGLFEAWFVELPGGTRRKVLNAAAGSPFGVSSREERWNEASHDFSGD